MNFFSSLRRDHRSGSSTARNSSSNDTTTQEGSQLNQQIFNPQDVDDVITLSTGPTTAAESTTLYGMKIMDDDANNNENLDYNDIERRYHVSRDDAESILGDNDSTSNNSGQNKLSSSRKRGMTICGFCDIRIASILVITIHLLYGFGSMVWIMMGYDFPSSTNTAKSLVFPISTICVTLVSFVGVLKYSHIVTNVGLVGTAVVWFLYLSKFNSVGICLGLLLIFTQSVFVREVRKGILTKATYEENNGRERFLHQRGQRVFDDAVVLKQELVKSSSLIGQQFVDESHQKVLRVTSEISTSIEQFPRTVSRMISEQSEPYLPTGTSFVRMEDGQNQQNMEENYSATATARASTTTMTAVAECVTNEPTADADADADALATSPKDVTDFRLLENRIGKKTTVIIKEEEEKDGEISSDSENYEDYRQV